MHPTTTTDEQAFDDLVNLSLSSKHNHNILSSHFYFILFSFLFHEVVIDHTTQKRLIMYSIAFPFIAAAEGIAPGMLPRSSPFFIIMF